MSINISCRKAGAAVPGGDGLHVFDCDFLHRERLARHSIREKRKIEGVSQSRGVPTLRAPVLPRRYVPPFGLGGAFRCGLESFIFLIGLFARGIVTRMGGNPHWRGSVSGQKPRVEPGPTAESSGRVRPLTDSMITSCWPCSSCAIPTAASCQLPVRPKALPLHPWPVSRW